MPLIVENVEVDPDRLVAGQRNARCENMPGNKTGIFMRSAPVFERCSPWLPTQIESRRSLPHHETDRIGGDVVRLDHELCILARRLAPLAGFDIHFTRRRGTLPPRKGQSIRRLKMGNITDDEAVRSVTQAPREVRFGACPVIGLTGDAEVQKSIS